MPVVAVSEVIAIVVSVVISAIVAVVKAGIVALIVARPGGIFVVRRERINHGIIVAIAAAMPSENGVEYIVSPKKFPERHSFVFLELRVYVFAIFVIETNIVLNNF